MSDRVKAAVADRLKDAGPEVLERIIEARRLSEIARREGIVIEALRKQDDAHAALRKHKPDVMTYNEDGSVFHAGYSKAKLDERKKLQEQVDKLDRLIEACFADKVTGAVYDELKKFADKVQVKPSKDEPVAEE